MQSKNHKKAVKKSQRIFKARLKKLGIRLNKDLPRSERWFRKLWLVDRPAYMSRKYKELYNRPLGRYIPDVLHKKFRYVIEVDGSVHDSPEQKARDQRKDMYYMRRGYRVFRVNAYSKISYDLFISEIMPYFQSLKDFPPPKIKY